jgi:hypothetical protein
MGVFIVGGRGFIDIAGNDRRAVDQYLAGLAVEQLQLAAVERPFVGEREVKRAAELFHAAGDRYALPAGKPLAGDDQSNLMLTH